MENSTELRKVVYCLLQTQIHFGIYRFGEKLPTIEETSVRLCVSIDTARAAYLELKKEGYITLTKNVGATVRVNYDERERARLIQAFFSLRKNAMIDLGNSRQPLFGNMQWIGLKKASPETLQAMENLSLRKNISVPYAMLEHSYQKYNALGNALLMRLVWQTFMFWYAPFFSIEENLQYFDKSADYLPTILELCQNKDWVALRMALESSMERMSSSLDWFYTSKITAFPTEEKVAFTWSSYKKSEQLCYSFAMDLLLAISRNKYPAGSLLPSQEELAKQHGVSVSTVRRALGLLGSVGAIKSERYVGTQVLPFDKATQNTDFSNPVLRRRLIDMAESHQLFALSCKAVSQLTLTSLDAAHLKRLCRELKTQKERERHEVLAYVILDLLAKNAPYQTIRTVYSELLLQFFWAFSLCGMRGDRETINAVYGPYYDDLIQALENADILRFSNRLEELMLYELHETADYLSRLGIPGTEGLLIPDKSEYRDMSGEGSC